MADKRRKNAAAEGELLVDEVASDHQGALSPFGNLSFPLPVEHLRYAHPEEDELPVRLHHPDH